MLCYQAKQALQDPAVAGNEDSLQIRLECFVDVMIRSSEREVLNEVAKVQEFFIAMDPDEFTSEEEAEAFMKYLKGQ
jgi:hypothetical protein